MRYEFEHDEITMCAGCPMKYSDSDYDFEYCKLRKEAIRTDWDMKKSQRYAKKFFKDCPLKKVEEKNE